MCVEMIVIEHKEIYSNYEVSVLIYLCIHPAHC